MRGLARCRMPSRPPGRAVTCYNHVYSRCPCKTQPWVLGGAAPAWALVESVIPSCAWQILAQASSHLCHPEGSRALWERTPLQEGPRELGCVEASALGRLGLEEAQECEGAAANPHGTLGPVSPGSTGGRGRQAPHWLQQRYHSPANLSGSRRRHRPC